MVISATECTLYSSISASVSTILSSGLIPIVQDRICAIVNHYFETDLYIQGSVDFDASSRTIISDGGDFDSVNFLAGDDIHIGNSFRNDGFFTLDSVAGSTLTVISGQSVVGELSCASVLISVVKWPSPVKHVAALMVQYDTDVRPKASPNLRSRSLGPWSESYAPGSENPYGYPDTIMQFLIPYRIARLA